MTYFASVIVPVHNNARVLAPIFIDVERYFAAQGVHYELLIMDRGSDDATPEIINRFHKLIPSAKIIKSHGQSEAQAVKIGLGLAKGKRVVLFHPDSNLAFDELGKALHRLEKGADIAVGSRFHKHSHNSSPVLQVRHNFSRLFHNLLIGSIAAPGVGDTESGFVCMRDNIIKNIIPNTKLNSAGYLIEILSRARKSGYKIEEFPVCSHGSRLISFASYGKLFSDSIKLLKNRI